MIFLDVSASMDSGKDPSQTNLCFRHPVSVNIKPPSELARFAIRAGHLSMSVQPCKAADPLTLRQEQ